MDTIFAQCSGVGRASVSVFRISGSKAISVLRSLVKMEDLSNLKPRCFYLKKIYHPKTNKEIDLAMIVFFRRGASFTGEDVVEIHTHGSIAVMRILNDALAILADRIAEAGEFAKRAFLNGKMDLTSSEGLADLIDAETHLQHEQAIKQMKGGLYEIYESWRKKLLKISGLIEVYLDFPDEDIPDDVLKTAKDIINSTKIEIKSHLNDGNRGERLRNGIKLAILGRPNAGKSSLFNYLMQRNVAIVSNMAGTTRDIIEGHIDIGGYPIILQDTAGIRSGVKNIIEQEGIRRAIETAKSSDIKIIICDASSGIIDERFLEIADQNTIFVFNKIDLCKSNMSFNISHYNKPIKISIKNKEGVNFLIDEIRNISEKIASPKDSSQITRVRYRIHLNKALQYLNDLSFDSDLVILAEDIRMIGRCIGGITGKITADEILGEIFSNFCIGK